MAIAGQQLRWLGHVASALREVLRFVSRHPWILIAPCAPLLESALRRLPPTVRSSVDGVSTVLLGVLLVAIGALLLWKGVRFLWKKVARRAVAPVEPIPRFYGVSYTDVHSNVRVCHLIPINLCVGTLKLLTNRLKEGIGVEIGHQPAHRRR